MTEVAAAAAAAPTKPKVAFDAGTLSADPNADGVEVAATTGAVGSGIVGVNDVCELPNPNEEVVVAAGAPNVGVEVNPVNPNDGAAAGTAEIGAVADCPKDKFPGVDVVVNPPVPVGGFTPNP